MVRYGVKPAMARGQPIAAGGVQRSMNPLAFVSRRGWRIGLRLAGAGFVALLVLAATAWLGLELYMYVLYRADLAAIRRHDSTIVDVDYSDEDPNRPVYITRTGLAVIRLREWRHRGRGPEMLTMLADPREDTVLRAVIMSELSQSSDASPRWNNQDVIPVLFAIVQSEIEPAKLRAQAAGMLPSFGLHLIPYLRASPISRDEEVRLRAIADQAPTEGPCDERGFPYQLRCLLDFINGLGPDTRMPPDP